MLHNPFAGAYGVEIGDMSLKLVELASVSFFNQKKYRVKELRSINLPPGLILDGEIQQPELVRKKLLMLLGREGNVYKPLKGTWVVANLPEPKTFIKMIDVESEPDELTNADVYFHAKKHLPFEIEQTYLDWQIISSEKGITQILIGAVPKVIADSYTFLLESVGLSPIALEIETIAISRAMITAQKDYEGQARTILDLGATRSSLIIYDRDSIQFTKILNFSGEIVTSAIEQGLKITRHEAEEMKIANGLKYDANQPKYLPIVSKFADNLVDELKAALSFYKEHFTDQNEINHITMCGGASNWKELDNFISRKLKIAAHPGHPWKNLQNPTLYNYEPEKSLALAAAIGLALRAIENPLSSNQGKQKYDES